MDQIGEMNLDLLSRLSDNPSIREAVAKARLVKMVREDSCVRVWTTESDEWEVRRSEKGDVYCTCPAWRFSKERPRTCKHCLAVGAVLNCEDIPVYLGKRWKSKV